MERTAVLYLSRKGNPPQLSRAFLHSLLHQPAGAAFDLIFVLKGFAAGEIDENLPPFAKALPCPVHELRIRDEIFHIAVFFELAAALAGYDRILFLNSYSRLLGHNWLASFEHGFAEVPNCGVVGATGGYEVMPGLPFPNIGLRTNAFLIARDLFTSLDPGALETQRGGNQFEAGHKGMTKQIRAMGLEAVIADKFGKIWRHEDWPESRTFRSYNQEGLLVSDNRTAQFMASSNRKRWRLARLNWGDAAKVTPISPLARLRAAWDWNYPKVRFP